MTNLVIIENAEIIIDKKRQYFYNNYTQNYNKDTNREMKHMANNCKFCGNPLEDWMAYCDNCGRKQDADAQNAILRHMKRLGYPPALVTMPSIDASSAPDIDFSEIFA